MTIRPIPNAAAASTLPASAGGGVTSHGHPHLLWRVVVIDPQPVARAGVSSWLDRVDGFGVVAQAADPAVGLEAVRARRPDLVVTELHFTDGGGLDLIRRLRGALPTVKVAVFTRQPSPALADGCRRLGVGGLFDKRRPPEVLLRGLRGVARGRRVYAVGVGDASRQRWAGEPGPAGEVAPDLGRLSRAEKAVFKLLGQGHTVRQIAAILKRSPKTVETHRCHLRHKLGCGSSADLMHRAIRWHELSN